MYMRVGPARMDPARIDEDSTLVQDIAEAFKQLPGFQSVMIGVDRTTGQFITVSTWDTEEHARARCSPAPTLMPGSRLSVYRGIHPSSSR